MQDIRKLVLKGCPRCHGDLLVDGAVPVSREMVVYECLQCGRTFRFAVEPKTEQTTPVAA
jgi:DNA-directed RNA polymerase subunit RPC12/RpoP